MKDLPAIRRFVRTTRRLLDEVTGQRAQRAVSEAAALRDGRILSILSSRAPISALAEAEFKVFSQFGDDGIIQWLIRTIQFPNDSFVEFGVEDYRESNTRFLLQNNNWRGLIMDGSDAHIRKIRESSYYWQHQLDARVAFVTTDNIDGLLESSELGHDLGILHIDIDGNDYWIWEAVRSVYPILVIVEYNSVFGSERAITVPYQADFLRSRAHPSNLYFGASLPALCSLAEKKGYDFIGCNSNGNNAYFVRSDRRPESVPRVTIAEGYVEARFREGRDSSGALTHGSMAERREAIAGLPVHNVLTGSAEPF